MTELPMFPLGSVLFPHMPLQLRVFEQRYLVMLSHILDDDPAEFGVVLIERGQEVGGGEHRFSVGTVAQIVELEAPEQYVALVAQGQRRIEVVRWLDDDPFPRASIRLLPDLEWSPELQPLLGRAEQTVRRVLSVASEFRDQLWPADIELSDDPIAAAWQLAGVAPLAELDQIALLRSATVAQLLTSLVVLVAAAEETIRASITGVENDGPATEQ